MKYTAQLVNQCQPIHRVIEVLRHLRGGPRPYTIGRENLGHYSRVVRHNMRSFRVCPLPLVNIISYGDFFFIVNGLRHSDYAITK